VLTVVDQFVFRGCEVVAGAVDASVVVPVDPFQGGASMGRTAQRTAVFAPGCCWDALAARKEHPMADNSDATADNLVGAVHS
jgi:hypothetical protein